MPQLEVYAGYGSTTRLMHRLSDEGQRKQRHQEKSRTYEHKEEARAEQEWGQQWIRESPVKQAGLTAAARL